MILTRLPYAIEVEINNMGVIVTSNTGVPKTPGSKIRFARLAKRLTLENLAKMSGISRPTIARIEKDDYKRLPTDIIEKILPFIGVTMDYIKDEPKGELDHLPAYLRDFVLNPENMDYIECAYLKKRQRELELKLSKNDQLDANNGSILKNCKD